LIEHALTFGGNFFFYGTFFSYVVFLIAFCFSHWWSTPMGRHVFFFMLVLAVVFGLGIASRVLGREWFDVHRAALTFWSFLATFLVGWWRVVLLLIALAFKPEEVIPMPPLHRESGDTDPNMEAVN